MRKVMLSILAVLLSLITLTTVTYAWISLARTATVENITINFVASQDLMISVDQTGSLYEKEYFSSIDGKMIDAILNNSRLIDVTSYDGINFKTLIGSNKIPTANKDYVKVDFYFRTTSRGLHNIYLVDHNKHANYEQKNKSGTFVISQGKAWKPNANFYYGPNNYGIEEYLTTSSPSSMFYLSEAIRIAFNEKTIDENDLRSSEELVSTIFDLSKDPSRGFGQAYGAYEYFALNNGKFKIPDQAQNVVTTLSNVIIDGPNVYTNNQDSKIVTLLARISPVDNQVYWYGKVTMSIWVEGWDPDAFDASFSDKIQIGLSFQGVEGVKP